MRRLAEEQGDASGVGGDAEALGNGPTHAAYAVERWQGGVHATGLDAVAEEVPVALVYNGVSHAVMLASPAEIEDFAIGFSLSEGIARSYGEILDIELVEGCKGIEAYVTLPAEREFFLKQRRRSLAGRTGCGLCGTESLDQLAGAAAPVPNSLLLAGGALARAESEITAAQPLFALTGAVHAAAWCSPKGEIQLVREDVGRHNALDKLIGALAAERANFSDGFVLMTSRASYEIVQKAAAVGIELVAAISAPTGMAIRVAEAAGVTLVGFARGDRHSVYTQPQRVRCVH
jgi:FdhD protein/phenylacetyl-CoA:acceptor oxidoreductase accessory protein